MMQILAIRAEVEELIINEESLISLGEIAQQASLRHKVQLLTPTMVVGKMNGSNKISQADLEEVRCLYLDLKSSARLLQDRAT